MENQPKLKCIYGNTVELKNLSTGDISKYDLVTFTDEVLSQNKISNYTPLGRAIWAKHEGDEVTVEHPEGGIQQFKIEKISNT